MKNNKTVMLRIRITEDLDKCIKEVATEYKVKASQAARMIIAQGVHSLSKDKMESVNNG